jgi:hypothetical protein
LILHRARYRFEVLLKSKTYKGKKRFLIITVMWMPQDLIIFIISCVMYISIHVFKHIHNTCIHNTCIHAYTLFFCQTALPVLLISIHASVICSNV